ncbi:MAG TPA: AAA family ATPase [Myxococcota bacterium]|nr:AAA family ATPase [Myxococcota bacterium]
MADPLPESNDGFTIDVEALRAFKDRARLRVRPLTLLYGRNQAGKSSLLRLLPWLGDCVFGRAPLVDLQSAALMGSTFKELGWLGPEPLSSPTLRLTSGSDGPFYEVQLTDESGVVPNRIRIGEAGQVRFDASWSGDIRRGGDAVRVTCDGTEAGRPWSGSLTFPGLLPEGAPERRDAQLRRLRASLEPLRRVQWLTNAGSDRIAPRRARCCESDGSDLPELLADRPEVVRRASDWLERCEPVRESVSLRRTSAGAWRIDVGRVGAERLPLQLAGEGLRWLVPLLLCAAWALEDDGPTSLAIEELEARLHPVLQVALFDHLVDLIRARRVPCVIETHSVYLLRAAQLAVATGRLAPEDVAIGWVERDGHAARLVDVRIGADGALEGWRPETFEEEQQLARDIFRARWDRRAGP